MKTALKIVGISLVSLAVLGGGIYAAAQALEETETDHDTISQEVHHVVIKAESGDIEVVPGGRSVEVERTDSYVIDSPDASQTLDHGVLTIEAECDGLASPFCSTDYRVEVPKGATVDVRTYVGDVEIDGIAARQVQARAYVGDVDVEMPKGTYDIDSDTAVGDSDVEGVIASDGAHHTVEAHSDVGTADVTAR